ncbi:MAG: TetR/AcrR family transcriptional regulator [Candidatus Thorarchaeota archaeon]
MKMISPKERLSKSERKLRTQKRLIIQAARKLFERKSYDDVSMENIADEAAVSKQTLYNYFSSKDSIYFGIGIEGFRNAIKRVEEMGFASLSGKDSVLKLTEIFFNTVIDFPLGVEISRRFSIINHEKDGIAEETLQKRRRGKSRMDEKKKSIEEDLADYLEQVWAYEKYWMNAIHQGQKDGTITSNLSEEQLMYYTFILINGVANQMQFKGKPLMVALKRGDLSHERIREITLRIMANLLENEV